MELPSSHHPLLALVDANKNILKCTLVKYIDVTVENQFGQLRNRIVHMIESGEIVNSNLGDENIQRISTQPNTTQINLSDQQSTLNTASSNSISINVQCSDAPNDGDKEQSNNADIEVNHDQSGQVSIDEVKEENDSDDEGEFLPDFEECEDCVNGICGLDGENDDALNDAQNDAHTGVNMLIGLGQDDQPNGSVASGDLVPDASDDLNQSSHNPNDLSILINDSEQHIRNNVRKSTRNETKLNFHCQSAQPVSDHHLSINIPSTSGLRSSDRKRIQTKVFGVDQSKGEGKNDKRKNMTQSSKAVKKVKHQEVDEIEQEEEEEKEAKLNVVTLEVNCTEPDCTQTLESIEMWKQHLSSIHDQIPYKQLADNVRHNQHGQAEYPCTKCDVVSKSQQLLYTHWKRYHLAGKFQCSVCEFVANFLYEVRNHYQKSHRSSKFPCTQEGCNQTFKFMYDIERHQRIHAGETPYKCTWNNCKVSFKLYSNAIQHVRFKHFRLPPTVKKQKKLNIIDERDPKVYVQVS